jgi:hypothetical protein
MAPYPIVPGANPSIFMSDPGEFVIDVTDGKFTPL